MKSGTHLEAVRTALKQAAKDAVSGTREQRSGRFLGPGHFSAKGKASLQQDAAKTGKRK